MPVKHLMLRFRDSLSTMHVYNRIKDMQARLELLGIRASLNSIMIDLIREGLDVAEARCINDAEEEKD